MLSEGIATGSARTWPSSSSTCWPRPASGPTSRGSPRPHYAPQYLEKGTLATSPSSGFTGLTSTRAPPTPVYRRPTTGQPYQNYGGVGSARDRPAPRPGRRSSSTNGPPSCSTTGRTPRSGGSATTSELYFSAPRSSPCARASPTTGCRDSVTSTSARSAGRR
ncbi:hypothetical protein ACRAWF_02070 [Streptomyces sp. L7]